LASLSTQLKKVKVKTYRAITIIRVDGVVKVKSYTSISPSTKCIQYKPIHGKSALLKTEVRIVLD